MQATFGQAEVLETAFDRLGHEPLETGKLLFRLEQQKRRSEHAYQVLEHLEQFKVSDTSTNLITCIDKGGEEAEEAVKIVRSLNGITEALKKDDQIVFVKNIQKFVKSVTVRLLTDFKEALSLMDTEKMSDMYRLLRLLDEEEECRNLFVQTNSLLTQNHIPVKNIRSLYHQSNEQPQQVIRVGREEPDEPLVKEALERLWIACADDDNHRTIVTIFDDDDADLVIAELIGTFVESQLKPMVNECLRQAKLHSNLARQRQLHSIFRQFTAFCARFEDCDTQNSIADAIDSLLQPYLQSIVADERQCNEELLRLLVANHNVYVQRKRVELRRSIISSSPLASPTVPPRSASFQFLLFTDGKPLLFDTSDDTISSDTVQRALVLTAEAAGRVMAIVGTSTAEHILPSLLSQLVSTIFTFDIVDILAQQTEPPKYGFDAARFSAVQSVHTALTALQLWFERHYGMLAAAVSAGCYAECVRIKSEAMRQAEQRQQRLMNLVLDWIVVFVREYYFKQHKRADYNDPVNEQSKEQKMEQKMEQRNEYATQYTQQLCLFTKRVASAMRERVEDAIADPWLHHLALRLLHSIMHDLVKRTVINESGAIQLLRDAQLYTASIPTHLANRQSSQLTALYAACLKDLARLYVVRVESVRAVVQEGGLASVDMKLVLPFVAARADVKAAPRLLHKYFPDYYIQ